MELVLTFEQIGSDNRESDGGKSYALGDHGQKRQKVPRPSASQWMPIIATWRPQVWAHDSDGVQSQGLC